MKESKRIKVLRDQALALIERKVTSDDPEFIKWRTKTSRFIKEKFGSESQEFKEFDGRRFYVFSFMLNSPAPSRQEEIEACATDLKEVAAELDAYLEIALEEEPEESEEEYGNNTDDEPKERRILISHAHADEDIVLKFVELLEAVGCGEDEIICSSVPPYCVPLSNNIYKWLGEKFQNYELHVIYMLSDNYYKSAACLNEMGAVWVMQQNWDAILLPKFEFRNIEGCIDPQRISIKLDDPSLDNLKYRLKELVDKIINEFGLSQIQPAYWERKRDRFISEVNERVDE